MIGPTGCGKTEIARRLAKLANAPFLKVEATKFTEVGYVGRDVEQIARDLMEAAIDMARERLRKDVRAKAELAAEDRVLDALCGTGASEETRLRFRHKLRDGELATREIEIEVADTGAPMQFEVPGQPGASVGMINIGDMLGKAFGGRTKKRKMTVTESYETLMREESDKLLDQERVVREARESVEQNGIVFIDEIDKITARSEFRGVPYGQAVRHAARAAGPPADPGEPGLAHPGRFPPHPDRARGQPGQAVQGAAGDREGRAGVQAGRHRRVGQALGRHQ